MHLTKKFYLFVMLIIVTIGFSQASWVDIISNTLLSSFTNSTTLKSKDKNDVNIAVFSESIKGKVGDDIIKKISDFKRQTITGKKLDSYISSKLGTPDLSLINLDSKYIPSKVITFKEIMKLIKTDVDSSYIIFKCGISTFEDKNICGKLTLLRRSIDDYILGKKNITINTIYKSIYILNVIHKYQALYLLYNSVKGGTILFTVNKESNILSEIDFVRNYSSSDTNTNDYITFPNTYVNIYTTGDDPQCKSNALCFVLGLSGEVIKGFKVYPLESGLKIQGAKKYKIMQVNNMLQKADCKYTDSYWEKYNGSGKIIELGMGHNGKNLIPDGAKGIKIDVINNCYKIEK